MIPTKCFTISVTQFTRLNVSREGGSVAEWPSGRVVRASDLKSVGRGFKSRSGCYLTVAPSSTTLAK